MPTVSDKRGPKDLTQIKAASTFVQDDSAHGRLTNILPPMPPLKQFHRFDVREMISRGVEPFPFIRERVDALKAGEGIIVVAPFLPSPLIEKLGSEGYASKVERGAGSDWLVYFWRETA